MKELKKKQKQNAFFTTKGTMATCKANNINFRAWVEDVLVRISTTPAVEIDKLLPHLFKPKKNSSRYFQDTHG
jgi:hypothetical protein